MVTIFYLLKVECHPEAFGLAKEINKSSQAQNISLGDITRLVFLATACLTP